MSNATTLFRIKILSRQNAPKQLVCIRKGLTHIYRDEYRRCYI